MTREERKSYNKAYYQAHKEQCKAYSQAYYQENKQEHLKRCIAYHKAHKEEIKAYGKAYMKEYNKTDVNSLGQTKNSIRCKSMRILKKSGIKIPDYEIHHCFGYEDASKFIYISKELHTKIHRFLRDNNIDADSDHWMAIRDLVNSTDEFMYIKC